MEDNIILILFILGIVGILVGIFWVRDIVKIFKHRRKLTKKDTLWLSTWAFAGVALFIIMTLIMRNLT